MTDVGKSEWHQGSLVSERLHSYMKMVAFNRSSDNYDDWYDALEGIRTELSTFMNEDELAESRKQLLNARKYLAIPLTKRQSLIGKKIWKLRDELEDCSVYLVQRMHKYGLYVPQSGTSGQGMASD